MALGFPFIRKYNDGKHEHCALNMENNCEHNLVRYCVE